MASLPYPLNWLYNHSRVGMAGMPYPPTDCRSYIKINTYLVKYTTYGDHYLFLYTRNKERVLIALLAFVTQNVLHVVYNLWMLSSNAL